MYLFGIIFFLGYAFLNIIEIRNISIVKCIYIFVIAFITDTYAYIGGSLIGKHKLTEISPKKTIEGSVIGSLMGTAITSIYYITTIDASNIFRVVLMTFILTILSEFGDLVFSSIKRHFKIKDYSNKICKEYGLSIIDHKSKVSDIKINEYQARIKGISWKQVLADDIDIVMEKSRNKYDFFRGMNELGYKVNWSKEKLSIIYTTPNGYKCSDKKLHNEKYLRENMEQYFKEKTKKKIQGVKNEKARYKSIHSSLAEIIEQFSRTKQAEGTTTLTELNKSAKKQLAIEMHYSTEELDDMEF